MKFDAKTIKKTFKWIMFVLLGAVYYVASDKKSTVVVVKERQNEKISTIELTVNNRYRYLDDDTSYPEFTIQGNIFNNNILLTAKTKVSPSSGIYKDFEEIWLEASPYQDKYVSKIEVTLNQSNDTASQAFYGGSFSYVSQPSLVITYNSINSDNYVRLDNGQYSSQCTSACTGHRIFFKAQNSASPLLDTYVKKKKKDTRIDVYLSDNGGKDFTIPLRRVGNWITSLF